MKHQPAWRGWLSCSYRFPITGLRHFRRRPRETPYSARLAFHCEAAASRDPEGSASRSKALLLVCPCSRGTLYETAAPPPSTRRSPQIGPECGGSAAAANSRSILSLHAALGDAGCHKPQENGNDPQLGSHVHGAGSSWAYGLTANAAPARQRSRLLRTRADDHRRKAYSRA